MADNLQPEPDLIGRIEIKGFKSLVDVSLDLGQVNVLIGANGAGKTSILEAIGVLSAAADGRVDDAFLGNRGVRVGTPRLYKTNLAAQRTPSAIQLCAASPRTQALYRVNLINPSEEPKPAWIYRQELWHGHDGTLLAGASPASRGGAQGGGEGERRRLPDRGLAALNAALDEADYLSLGFLERLQRYAIFAPATRVMRALTEDRSGTRPVGLWGGRLPEALWELLRYADTEDAIVRPLAEAVRLLGWAKSFAVRSPRSAPPHPSLPPDAQSLVLFDRHMSAQRNRVTLYDASEGALYQLLMLVLCVHPDSAPFLAVENFDMALNPSLVRELTRSVCKWVLQGPARRQIILTTHNPLALDGLDLANPQVRLFVVARSRKGQTVVRRLDLGENLDEWRSKDLPLSRLWVRGDLGGLSDV